MFHADVRRRTEEEIVADEMTIGMMLALLACRSSFIASATALVDQGENYRLLSVHPERLSDIVARPREHAVAAA